MQKIHTNLYRDKVHQYSFGNEVGGWWQERSKEAHDKWAEENFWMVMDVFFILILVMLHISKFINLNVFKCEVSQFYLIKTLLKKKMKQNGKKNKTQMKLTPEFSLLWLLIFSTLLQG